jgi:ActR/RegA family two-component response regulator
MTIPKAKLADPTANSHSGQLHTLVIDDDKAVADTLAMVLNADGFEARAVYSGEAASNLPIHRTSPTNHGRADRLLKKTSYWSTLVSASKPIQKSSRVVSEPQQLRSTAVPADNRGRDLNCPLCRGLEQAYEAALTEYIEACSSASFYVCSNLAARKNVDMERTKYELEEHSLVCISTKTTVAPLPEQGMSTNLKQLVMQ